jgi:hypothetical protein
MDETRICVICTFPKPIEEFTSLHGTYLNRCKKCSNERSREYKRKEAEAKGLSYGKVKIEAPEGFAYCSDCKDFKPVEEFVKQSSDKRGHGSYCKPHSNARGYASRDKKLIEQGLEPCAKKIDREVPEGMLWCPDCEDFKSTEEFPKNRSSKTGFGGYCKPHHNARGTANTIQNWGSTREYHLRQRYNITGAEVEEMFKAQDGKCAICGQRSDRELHVDHDHLTGEVRELLCFNHNAMLGKAGDSIEVLEAAIEYLRKHGK